MLPKVSLAVTVTLAELPAVTEAGVPVSARVAAAAGSTVMPALVPVTEPCVAVTVWEPAVVSVTGKVWTPLSPPTKV